MLELDSSTFVPLTADVLDEFESILGWALPAEYRSFLVRFNGSRSPVDHDCVGLGELDRDLGLEFFYWVDPDEPDQYFEFRHDDDYLLVGSPNIYLHRDGAVYARLEDDPDLPHWDLGLPNYALGASSWNVYVDALQPTEDKLSKEYWPVLNAAQISVDAGSLVPVSDDDVATVASGANPWRYLTDRVVTQVDVDRFVDAVAALPAPSQRLIFLRCMFVGDIDFTSLVGGLHVTGRFSGACTIGSGVRSFDLDRSVFEQSLKFSAVNTGAFADLVAVRVHGPLSVEHCSFNPFHSDR